MGEDAELDESSASEDLWASGLVVG